MERYWQVSGRRPAQSGVLKSERKEFRNLEQENQTTEKGKKMKTNYITRLVCFTGIAVAAVLFAGLAGVNAQNGAKGGATKLLQLNGGAITAKSESSVKPMGCGKCKDEFVKRVDWSTRGANRAEVLAVKHLCASCGNEWTTVGHGKAKVSLATHKCTNCGEAAVACCNTKNAGVATKGMEKKFEVAPLK
jgi:hypothetical protein